MDIKLPLMSRFKWGNEPLSHADEPLHVWPETESTGFTLDPCPRTQALWPPDGLTRVLPLQPQNRHGPHKATPWPGSAGPLSLCLMWARAILGCCGDLGGLVEKLSWPCGICRPLRSLFTACLCVLERVLERTRKFGLQVLAQPPIADNSSPQSPYLSEP